MMIETNTGPGFWGEMRARPILWAFAAIWVIDAMMNTIYGYRRAAGVGAIGYAAAFFAIAVVAAWLPVQIRLIKGTDFGAWVQRVALSIPLVVCLIVSQVAGWAVMGVTMADGQAAREDKAMSRTTIRQKLESARAEYATLAAEAPGDPDTLRVALDETRAAAEREGDRVRCGPKCEALKLKAVQYAERLSKAERAAELEDTVIPDLEQRLKTAPKTAEGAPAEAVLARIFSVSDDEVRFWWTVALVFAIGMFANLGFALAGVGERQAPRAAAPREWEAYQPVMTGPGHPGPDWAQAETQHAAHTPPDARAQAEAQGRDHSEHGWQPPTSTPLHIHLSGASTPPSSAPGSTPAELPHRAGGSHPPASLAPAPADGKDSRQSAPSAPAPPAADKPVKRDRIRQLTDQLLTFRAACVTDSAGGVVEAGELYARYAQWAGDQAIPRGAFETLFPTATGLDIVHVGGAAHYADVALKRAELKAVGEA